jgi:Spy/CpxP family protein refolding chaperone
MRRKILISGLVVAALGTVGLVARAMPQHGGHMRERIQAHVDDAMDAVSANQVQRNAVEAAAEHVFDTIKNEHGARRQDFQTALNLFASDKIDPAVVQKLRASRQAAQKATGDAVVDAIATTFQTLDATQRQQLVTYIRTNHPQLASTGEGVGPRVMRRMFKMKVDATLDAIKATPEQRAKVAALQTQLQTSFANQHALGKTQINQLLDLFNKPTLDRAKLDSLRSAHQAAMQKLGDEVVNVVTQLHDVLTSAQRQQIVAQMREHMSHWQGRRGKQ